MASVGVALLDGDLARVSRANEDIKEVLEIFAGINLAALNAKLMAHRGGARSVGFGVVSAELRSLTRKLDVHMGNLQRMVMELVGRVAELQKSSRVQARIEEAVTRVHRGEVATRLAELLSPRRAAHEGAVRSIERERGRLGGELSRALKLCRVGRTVAQRAKVEAVYGKELAGPLTQVSNEVEDSVEKALVILARIQEHIEG